MKTIGVVGAGTMGAGIAHVAAAAGFTVLLSDLSEDAVRTGLERIASDLRKSVEKGKLTAEESARVLARIQSRTALTDLSPADIIIEAAVENLGAKQQIFSKLEAVCFPQTIFASNTSSLSITAIASSLQNPARLVGMHFFNPAHLMKLVEVIKGHQTSEETVEATKKLAEQMGKTAVVATDTPGFIVNRIARPFYGEALRLLGEGVTTVEEIDRIVKLSGGFRMGPFELMDLIGIDINFAVTQSMYEQTFGEARYRPHPIQQKMVHARLLGRKTKRGFYRYDT